MYVEQRQAQTTPAEVSERHKVHVPSEAKEPKEPESCPICLDDLEERNRSVTNCGHVFCLQCIIKHSHGGDNRCPLCRAEIVEGQENVPNNSQEELDHRLMDIALRRRLVNICCFITPRHEYEHIARVCNMLDRYDSETYNIDIDLYVERLIQPIHYRVRRQRTENPPQPRPPIPPSPPVPVNNNNANQDRINMPPPPSRAPPNVPVTPPPAPQRQSPPPLERVQIRRRSPVRCSICNEVGHNRRTCPLRHLDGL